MNAKRARPAAGRAKSRNQRAEGPRGEAQKAGGRAAKAPVAKTGSTRTPAGRTPAKGGVRRHPAYATVEQTILERNDELVQRYGAHHIGVSKKYRQGARLSDTCITFYVMRKGNDVDAEQVPKHIVLSSPGGSRKMLIATDVCEIGEEPAGFRLRGGHLVVAGDGETGTVGLVFRRGNSDFFLTNAHVVTDPGAPPNHVRVHPPGAKPIVAPVVRMDNLAAPLIRSDAALVRLPPNTVGHGEFHGVPLVLESCGDIVNNDPRRFFYVAANFVHVVRWRGFVPAASPIWIDGQLLRYAGFHKFDVLQGRCGPGHSGSVIFCETQGGLKAVGLLFGGVEETNEVWAFPIRTCLMQMGVDPDSL